jgi:hypothetical protein
MPTEEGKSAEESPRGTHVPREGDGPSERPRRDAPEHRNEFEG